MSKIKISFRRLRNAEDNFWRQEVEIYNQLTILSMPIVKWEADRLRGYPVFSYTGVPIGITLRLNDKGHILHDGSC